MNDVNLPVLPIREERRRRSDRRSSDPAKRDRRRANSAPWTGPERRRGPRRIYDRRKQNILQALLATLLCMLCLAAPPDLHADNSNPDNSNPGCVKPPVMVEFFGRAREAKEFSFARCDGTPNLAALDEFSVHVRPRGARLPQDGVALRRNEQEGFVARDIRRFDARVLARLQDVAERWPGRRIVVVSAYRPGARVGSRHHHAQAIDIRVEGVHRAEVAEFARSLPETGVGFYPASTFTHIDVRVRPSFWVDQSEPGQRSRYVPGDEEDAFFAAALAALPSRNAIAATEPGVPAAAATIESPAEPANTSSAASAATVTASAGSSVQTPTLRRDVQRTLREGLASAFVVGGSEAGVAPRTAQASRTAQAPPAAQESEPAATTPRVTSTPSPPASIDWDVPW